MSLVTVICGHHPDPNYASGNGRPKNPTRIYYENVSQFLNGDMLLHSAKNKSDILYPQNVLTPKFDYLKALSIGEHNRFKILNGHCRILCAIFTDSFKDAAQDVLNYITE